jgi:hypothetical protein
MRAQFDQKVLSSFYLWFDDRLVRYGEAVESGISQNFYYSPNSVDISNNQVAYYSPDRQFVSNGYDVPSGVYIDSTGKYDFVHQKPNNSTGLMIDHDQGRVILNSSMGTGLSISGNFSRKTVNTYITNESEEELLLNTDFLLAEQDDQTFLESMTGFASLNYTVPAAFISYNSSLNKPFALGGLQDTRSNIRAVVITNDNYTLDSILSLFRDSTEVCVPIVDYAEFPYGEFFHVKNPPYTYETLYRQKMDANAQYAFIEKISSSKLHDSSNSAINIPRNMRIGFVDFALSTPRMPKIELGSPTFTPPEPPSPLDEVQVTITGPELRSFYLDPGLWPENRGFTSYSIKENESLPSTYLSYFFTDEISTKPDSITSTEGMKLATFKMYETNRLFVEMEYGFGLYSLDSTVTITFTLQYF